jgi:hypothetical protein
VTSSANLILNDSMARESSRICRVSWPESSAPVLVAVGPYITRGGDSIATLSVAVWWFKDFEEFLAGWVRPDRDRRL